MLKPIKQLPIYLEKKFDLIDEIVPDIFQNPAFIIPSKRGNRFTGRLFLNSNDWFGLI